MKKILLAAATAIMMTGCNKNGNGFDASGTFEADETVVSSELFWKDSFFQCEEGMQLGKGQHSWYGGCHFIDLQQQQVEASINALNQKQPM